MDESIVPSIQVGDENCNKNQNMIQSNLFHNLSTKEESVKKQKKAIPRVNSKEKLSRQSSKTKIKSKPKRY